MSTPSPPHPRPYRANRSEPMQFELDRRAGRLLKVDSEKIIDGDSLIGVVQTLKQSVAQKVEISLRTSDMYVVLKSSDVLQSSGARCGNALIQPLEVFAEHSTAKGV